MPAADQPELPSHRPGSVMRWSWVGWDHGWHGTTARLKFAESVAPYHHHDTPPAAWTLAGRLKLKIMKIPLNGLFSLRPVSQGNGLHFLDSSDSARDWKVHDWKVHEFRVQVAHCHLCRHISFIDSNKGRSLYSAIYAIWGVTVWYFRGPGPSNRLKEPITTQNRFLILKEK